MDLARCIGIFIGFVGRCASGRSPGERSLLFVTTQRATILALGFGTYGMPRSDILRMIPAALNAGIRHFDTAQIYRNEACF
jgi:diketogulonate reductase-like aldo/keto reductase